MDDKQLPQAQNNKPVISNATVKKPSIVKELVSYSVENVVEPRMKEMTRDVCTGFLNMVNDALTKSIDRLIYPDGNSPHKNNSSVKTYTPTTNYTVYSKTNSKPPRESIGTRSSIEVNYIWVETEDEAKQIVNTLIENIDNYGKAKVADLYEMVKIPTTFSDYKFGWSDTKGIGYYRDRGKYFIDLPKPVNIENV